jgi:hypothetical protein
MPIKRTTQEEIDKKLQESQESTEDTTENSKSQITNNDEDPEGEEANNGSETENQEEEEIEGNEEETTEGEDNDQNLPVKKQPSVEERYKQSTQEAQILHNKNKKFSETVEKAAKIPEPTEEEMKNAYPDWDVMSATEQKLAKESVMHKKKFDMIHGVVLEGKKVEEWAEEVDSFLIKAITQYPSLDGKEEQFKRYCMKESRRGVDFDILVNAFLNLVSTTKPPRKKGSLFSTASGGKPDKKKQEQYIDEKQAAILRKNDQKTYNRLVREGKIKFEL